MTRNWSDTRRHLRNVFRKVCRPFAYAYITVEYLVLLLLHARQIARADYATALWFWSFGHQAIDPHMLAMRFRGKNIIVLLSDYGNFNRYIVDAFRPHVRIAFLRHPRCMQWLRNALKIAERRDLKLALLQWFLKTGRFKAAFIREFNEERAPYVGGIFITERIRRFAENADMKIVPPPEAIERFRAGFANAYPELASTWFVSLYLRKKAAGKREIRDTDPGAYAVVPRRIAELGGFVFCGGDYHPRDVFGDLPRILGYRDLLFADRALADIYFITQCRFIVAPASGPVAVAISFNVPSLITNDALFYHSGSRANQIVLYKKVRERATGRILSARETFSFPVIEYRSTEEFDQAGLEVIDNTEEEIAAALEEMIQRFILLKEPVGPEHQSLYDRFKSLLPKESVVYQTPSRPALSYLQRLEW